MAKRGRGRPRKPAEAHARRVLISLDPQLLAMVEAFASAKGLDRSKLFALSVEAFMASDKAHQAAAAARLARSAKRSAAAAKAR